MRRLAFLPLLLLLFLPGCASSGGGRGGALQPGDRVRMTAPGGERTTGRVIRRDDGTLGVRVGRADSLVTPGPDQTVDVSLGRQRGVYAAVGALAGATAVVTIARADNADDDGDPVGYLDAQVDAINALLAAVAGGVVGYFVAPERWRRVSPARVVVRPEGGGVAVGLSVPR